MNKVTDAAGNYFAVTYIEYSGGGEYRPSRIDYTGNTATGLAPYASVNFLYEARPDITVGYRAVSAMSTNLRLKLRRTQVGQTIVRHYNLLYQGTQTFNQTLSRLAYVQAYGYDNVSSKCLPATSLGWQDYPAGFAGVTPSHSNR